MDGVGDGLGGLWTVVCVLSCLVTGYLISGDVVPWCRGRGAPLPTAAVSYPGA